MKGENRVLFGLARCCPIHKANTQQKFCPTQPRVSLKCKRSWFAAKFSNLLRQLLYPLFSSAKILETDEKSKKTEENYFWENTCTSKRKETKMSELGPEPVSVNSYIFNSFFDVWTVNITKNKISKNQSRIQDEKNSEKAKRENKSENTGFLLTFFLQLQVNMRCPHCDQNVQTNVVTKPGTMAFVLGLGICCLG